MPIAARLRWFYPIDWPLISRRIRFERAAGRCERCRRPHGAVLHQVSDGRWLDEAENLWRNDRGRVARAPRPEDLFDAVRRRVMLQTVHLDHDPANNHERNLAAFCGRCALEHARPRRLEARRLSRLMAKACGDLFTGPYRPPEFSTA